jgi:hypothetical protein
VLLSLLVVLFSCARYLSLSLSLSLSQASVVQLPLVFCSSVGVAKEATQEKKNVDVIIFPFLDHGIIFLTYTLRTTTLRRERERERVTESRTRESTRARTHARTHAREVS